MIVARSTNVKAAELLLAYDASVNAVETQKQQSALMWAAGQSQGPMVRTLIAHGADVNARAAVNPTATANYSDSTYKDWPSNVSTEPRAGPRAPGGLTPLLLAAREGCTDCVKALIEGKANLDMPDPEGITPLIMAITNLHFDAAAALIKAGANPDRWDLWGRGPLYCAVDMNTLPHGGRTDLPSLDDTTGLQIIEMLLDRRRQPEPAIETPASISKRGSGPRRGWDADDRRHTTGPRRKGAGCSCNPIARRARRESHVDRLPVASLPSWRLQGWVRWMRIREGSTPPKTRHSDRAIPSKRW